METDKIQPAYTLNGRYEVYNRLGTGGMAHVYRARDTNLQRDVAVKVLRDNLIQDPDFLNSFMLEARSVANLSHPNIVTVFDFGHDQSRYFIVMELISGTDLKTLLRRRRVLPILESLDDMIQICAGVGYAHRSGLVHCDIKPQNILITPDSQVRVTDFGISRALATIDPDEKAEVVWGSPLYLAPELSAGRAPSPSSDVYALGVILFEMVTGQLPFQADSAEELAYMHQSVPPPSPRSLNPGIPVYLDEVILKVLSKEPSARYRTADQLGHVLETISSQMQDAPHADLQKALDAIPVDPDGHTQMVQPSPREEIDWFAVLLGLLAFIAVGGLIPLWLFVCLLYPACPLTTG
jgi:serine/threonine protein kinase